MTQLLLVDDDRDLCSLISDFLTSNGIAVEMAHDGPACLRAAAIGRFDLILLDVMMPGMDGFAVLGELRRFSDTPVVMLTARGEPADRIAGLRLGADDYLPKPFDPDELLARIQAILRRVTGVTVRESSPNVEIAGVRLNPSARSVTCNDQLVDLTAAEYEILEQLMRAAGRPVSRDEISLRLYQREASPFDRSIDVHLSHIRRKLGASGAMIRTIRGAGYLFALDKSTDKGEEAVE
ncbi:response regulator transcription factor [uncultured Paludibaculum sp.]|uniref:response regulator transcription factor n=1 Tax=uncultured Paludibaculum sp. TaxID=1765020 RepID=UPI002AAB2F58|nr:response regulator transcription factor [uncultured Paludibaculum sp.]